MALLLVLDSSRWRLEVAGPLRELPPFLTVPDSVVHLKGEAKLRVASKDGSNLHRAPHKSRVTPIFFENTTYDCYLTSRTRESAVLEPPLGASLRLRRGEFSHYRLAFGNDVGWAELAVTDSQGSVRLRFEVFPIKIDYRADYVALRNEVTAIARSLAMTVQARTFALAKPVPSEEPTLAEWIALLQGYFEQFVRTASVVIRNPRFTLTETVRSIEPARAREVDQRALDRSLRRPLSYRRGGFRPELQLPRRVPEVRRRTTFDNPENRYFKYLLSESLRRLKTVALVQDTGDEDAELSAEHRFFAALRPQVGSMIQRVQRLLRAPFLADVNARPLDSLASPVLSGHPAYSAFVQTARLLNSGLSLEGGILRIGLKNIAQLYEYWCFLRIVRLFRENFRLEQQSLVRLRHLRFVIVLAKGKEASVTFKDTISGKRLDLVYDRMFRGLPTVSQRPDNVIKLASEQRMYILDAKYRLAYDIEYWNRYGGVGPTTEDINTMHRYRDAIVIPHPFKHGEFQRGVVQGAAVLFPFGNESDYQEHRFFKSLKEVQIGGLPFLPRTCRLTEDYIREILRLEGYAI